MKPNNQQFSKDEKAFQCSVCNGTFPKPILATLFTDGQTQTYYACPCCLTKVVEKENPKSKRGKKAKPLTEKVEGTAPTTESYVKCKHFLGCLRKCQKDMAIPNECLLCERMVDCLIH